MCRSLGRVLALAAAIVVLSATAAAAHVSVGDSSVAPDGAATLTFTFRHGCDGQPTNSLRIQVPEGVTDVVAQPVDGWQSSVTATELAWTGGSIPDGVEANFTATMQVSGPAGTTIWFPAVQNCPSGEEAWIETAAPGQPEPPNVAPSIVLATTIEATTTTTAAPPTTAASSNTTRTTLVPGEAAVTEAGSSQNTTGRVVFFVVVAIIVGGAVVLFLRYRGRGNTKLPE